MAHPQQTDFVRRVRELFPTYFTGTRVLEVGSLNINGTVRDLFTACSYIGIDVAPGPCVDMVAPRGAAEALASWAEGSRDVAISTECFEHDPQWRETLAQMVRVLRPGGLLIITCAGRNRPEHGTARTTPNDVAPGFPWPDHYQGLDEADLREALDLSQFTEYAFEMCVSPADTYLWAIKK